MNSVDKLAQNLTAILKDLDTHTTKAVEKCEPIMIELNRANMMQGFNIDGSEIGGYASYVYEQMKSRMNAKAGGRVDLFLDGGYQGSMFVEIKGNIFKIKSEDVKYNDLIAKYGDDHFGIPKKDSKLFAQVLKSELIKILKQIL
jgi:DNA-binding sugar fermentation-stimulating protein